MYVSNVYSFISWVTLITTSVKNSTNVGIYQHHLLESNAILVGVQPRHLNMVCIHYWIFYRASRYYRSSDNVWWWVTKVENTCTHHSLLRHWAPDHVRAFDCHPGGVVHRHSWSGYLLLSLRLQQSSVHMSNCCLGPAWWLSLWIGAQGPYHHFTVGLLPTTKQLFPWKRSCPGAAVVMAIMSWHWRNGNHYGLRFGKSIVLFATVQIVSTPRTFLPKRLLLDNVTGKVNWATWQLICT